MYRASSWPGLPTVNRYPAGVSTARVYRTRAAGCCFTHVFYSYLYYTPEDTIPRLNHIFSSITATDSGLDKRGDVNAAGCEGVHLGGLPKEPTNVKHVQQAGEVAGEDRGSRSG